MGRHSTRRRWGPSGIKNDASFAQTSMEIAKDIRGIASPSATEEPDHRKLRLLRERRERPSNCCTAEKRDEIASSHCLPQRHSGPRRLPRRLEQGFATFGMGFGYQFALQQSMSSNVCMGSKREAAFFGLMSASSASSGHWVANASAALCHVWTAPAVQGKRI